MGVVLLIQDGEIFTMATVVKINREHVPLSPPPPLTAFDGLKDITWC